MQNDIINNILSSDEVQILVNDSIVKLNKEKLSHENQVVNFSIPLSDAIKTKLENSFSIDLSQITSIPMRWIKGDTLPHTDKGESQFNNTYLVYLTDSIGNFVIDGQSYPITAGSAHVFSEGLEHYTINTSDSERLLIGPMSETGFRVGASLTIIYYDTETSAQAEDFNNAIGSNYEDFDVNTNDYIIQTFGGISSWNILKNNYGTGATPNGGPYNSGDELIQTGTYHLYPYTAPAPAQVRSLPMHFTDNSIVYYKTNSLSTGGGGSGVRNCRHKQRRT